MKSVLVLAAAISLASCSAKVSSGGGAPVQPPPSFDFTPSPGTQELKVKGITEGSDGGNKVVVVRPNTTAQNVSFTVDAKESGKLELSLDSSMEVACTGGQLEVKKYFEDMTGGNVVSKTDAVGGLPMIAGHSYRVRYSITAAGACDGYQEDFRAVFSAGEAPMPGPSDTVGSQPLNSCATAYDIGTFYANAAPGDWCEHTVTNPETSVSGGRSIGTADQLAVGTKLSIVAGKMTFAHASSLCNSVGAGFALPLSVDSDAFPRAASAVQAAKSLERVGKYLANIRYISLWSGSSANSMSSSTAWMADLAGSGGIYETAKTDEMFVVCVK